VQEIDAELERAVDRRGRFLLVTLAVELGHAHAPEPELRHGQSLASKLALFHAIPLPATFRSNPRPSQHLEPIDAKRRTRKSSEAAPTYIEYDTNLPAKNAL